MERMLTCQTFDTSRASHCCLLRIADIIAPLNKAKMLIRRVVIIASPGQFVTTRGLLVPPYIYTHTIYLVEMLGTHSHRTDMKVSLHHRR